MSEITCGHGEGEPLLALGLAGPDSIMTLAHLDQAGLVAESKESGSSMLLDLTLSVIRTVPWRIARSRAAFAPGLTPQRLALDPNGVPKPRAQLHVNRSSILVQHLGYVVITSVEQHSGRAQLQTRSPIRVLRVQTCSPILVLRVCTRSPIILLC